MDAKAQSVDTALGAHTNDGSTKYAPCATAQETNGNKPYHAIGSNLLGKVDVPTARPCAIIGPDRVVPPQPTSDVYLKKAPVEPWPYTDNLYHPPPEYPHKPADYPPPRNISPRQTFQENMQRIMVPPTYVSVKNNEDRTLRNSKLLPPEAKFCDVPYTISPLNIEPKTTKSSDGLVPNNNSAYTQAVLPPGWPTNSVNVRPLRPYGAPEIYQYSEYPNYPGPRPISMIRPHRNIHEDVPQAYQDRFHPEANVRFKPYPSPKERPHQHLQPRYDYIANYPNTYHLHNPYSTHKYDLQKSMPPQPCPVYPPMSLKYLDRRMPAPNMERYQRSPNQQVNFNPSFCNQNIPPTYGSVPGNCVPSRPYPYSPDPSTKPVMQNRLYFDSNNLHKYYPNPDMYVNDINRPSAIKNNMLYQSYPSMQPLPPHLMYRKDNAMKGFEHATHFRNFDYPGNLNQLPRLPVQFSPQTISISPDSNASNETTHVLNAQEDCGYVSQSSTASVRSIESGVNKMSNDLYRRQATTQSNTLIQKKLERNSDIGNKDKKCINVRQFLQMWNEGDEEGNDNSKETVTQKDLTNNLSNTEPGKSQEQLYILDLVNVPNEELGKYEHIQKISKLPENIKGYSSIELLNQYEKLVEAPGMNQYTINPPPHSKQKDLHAARNNVARQGIEALPRPISPLDVEAKISQSVIHKEVGCNFEIRPCSPQMLNVELATPVHNVLGERFIEKVVNPVISKSPMIRRIDEPNISSSKNSPKSASCKMVHNQYPSPNINDSLKSNYCLQDLETNSGVGLASLPRLDNDIELNFPEINQQFINANKIEPIRNSSTRDLPVLNPENVSNTLKSKNVMLNMPLTSENSGSESDKEFSKLSKYRKHKRNSSVANESEVNLHQNMAIHRTDSVIIKNPENANNNIDIHLNEIKSSSSDTINTLNVLVDSDRLLNYVDQSFASPIGDTAIDFSLNKSDDHITFDNCVSNLSDTIQGNMEIDKHLLTDNDHGKVYTENSLTHSKENLSSGDFTVPQSNSPQHSNHISTDTVLRDEYTDKPTNSSILDHNKNHKTITEENIIHHETVITHSKPQETQTNKHSSEDMLPQRESPSTPSDNESIVTNTALSNNIENNLLTDCSTEIKKSQQNSLLCLLPDVETQINSDNETLCEFIEKPILNNSVVNEPTDLHNAVCQSIDDKNLEYDLCFKKELKASMVNNCNSDVKFDNDTLHNEHYNSHLPSETLIENNDSIKITESKNAEFQKVAFKLEENEAKENNAKTIAIKDASHLEDRFNVVTTDKSKQNYIEANSEIISKDKVNAEIIKFEEKSNDDIEHLSTTGLNFSKLIDTHSNDSLEEGSTIHMPDTKKECESKNIAMIKPYNGAAESKDFSVMVENSGSNDTKNTVINFEEAPELQLRKSLIYKEPILENNILPNILSTDNADEMNSHDMAINIEKDLTRVLEDSIQCTFKNKKEAESIAKKINVQIDEKPESEEAVHGLTDAKYSEENNHIPILNENNNSENEKVNISSEASNIQNKLKSEVSKPLTCKEYTSQEKHVAVIMKDDPLDKVHACAIDHENSHISIMITKDLDDKANTNSVDISVKNTVKGEDIELLVENQTRNFNNVCNKSTDTIDECKSEKNPVNDEEFPDTINSSITAPTKNEHESEISKTLADKESMIEHVAVNINNDFDVGYVINNENMGQSQILKTCTYNNIKVGNKKKSKSEHEHFFRKELYSSQFQNLLLYSHGYFTQCNKVMDLNQENECCYNDIKNNIEQDINNSNNDSIANNNIEELSIEIDTYVSIENAKKRLSQDYYQINDSDKTIKFKDSEGDERNEFVENITLQELFEEPDKNKGSSVIQDTAPKNDVKEVLAPQKSHQKQSSNSRKRTLKRSLSESAADSVKEGYDSNFMIANKRTKVDDEILVESQMIAENLTNFIQTNRRNSISTIYNDENMSFCIVFDNDCVLTEENGDCQKICYTEIESGESGDCLTTISVQEEAVNSTELPDDYLTTSNIETELTQDMTLSDMPCEYSNEFILHNNDRSIEATWVEDVACMETVYSDDIAEDIVISAPSSPTISPSSEDEADNIFCGYNHVNENEHTNKVKHIYGNQMCDDDAQLVEKLYRTPQMDVNKTLIHRESRLPDEQNRYYDTESLERVLSESYTCELYPSHLNNTQSLLINKPRIISEESVLCNITCDDTANENIEHLNIDSEQKLDNNTFTAVDLNTLPKTNEKALPHPLESKIYDDSYMNHCESSCDKSVTHENEEEQIHYTISSSPEVSSTTPEEKGSSILLKIRSYKGTKISEVNDMSPSFNQTHSQRFSNSIYNLSASRPLRTKAAQKYIPPLKETIRDLKVKLHLPKHSLHKLQQLKKSKEEPKKNTNHSKNNFKSLSNEYIKKTKPKPKFEDVLKSIDEIQFKMHKDKNKKPKQSIPKVIIKKNENGAHYTSTKSKEKFNPDLTGCKWQPWVFLEKNKFIDKMALKQKFKAIYSHRKKTYVLAESFRKYKSISTSKFVISHPKSCDSLSTGKLKYTFKLKHD